MDRRQRKTREAIFEAFTRLLEKKKYSEITVQHIIDGADIGRATFYSHFETKDYLLRDLCEELFGHIINTALGAPHENSHFSCEISPSESVFLHLLKHLQENDRNILSLLSSKNNELFLSYFKANLKKLIETKVDGNKTEILALPKDYLVNHIASSFAETLSWWIGGGMKESPEELYGYFNIVTSACGVSL